MMPSGPVGRDITRPTRPTGPVLSIEGTGTNSIALENNTNVRTDRKRIINSCSLGRSTRAH